MKRTYQPNPRRKAKKHGFRQRQASTPGKAILRRRQQKGRKRLTTLS